MRTTSFSLLIISLISNVILYAGTTPVLARVPCPSKRDYRRPPPLPVPNPALAELGRDLFFDPQLSASGKTTCASCHFQDLGWGVTDARSRSDSGTPTSRKSQPLLGIGHAG